MHSGVPALGSHPQPQGKGHKQDFASGSSGSSLPGGLKLILGKKGFCWYLGHLINKLPERENRFESWHGVLAIQAGLLSPPFSSCLATPIVACSSWCEESGSQKLCFQHPSVCPSSDRDLLSVSFYQPWLI